jgi:prepilin-type N-terminal cleavage/methylation domain-containing protein
MGCAAAAKQPIDDSLFRVCFSNLTRSAHWFRPSDNYSFLATTLNSLSKNVFQIPPMTRTAIGAINANSNLRSNSQCLPKPLRQPLHCSRQARGFTLPELMVSVIILGLLTTLGLNNGSGYLKRQQLEGATRRLIIGLEQGRDAARRKGAACSLQLTAAGSASGWAQPASSNPAPCPVASMSLMESTGWPGQAQLQFAHNFSGPVIFTANGLVNSGGTAVLAITGTDLVRCVVVSAVMGVTRAGSYAGAFTQSPIASSCKPDSRL